MNPYEQYHRFSPEVSAKSLPLHSATTFQHRRKARSQKPNSQPSAKVSAWLGPLKSVRHEDPAVAEAPEGDGILLQRASVGSRILPKWCEMRKLFIEYADRETHTQTHSEECSARSGKMILKKSGYRVRIVSLPSATSETEHRRPRFKTVCPPWQHALSIVALASRRSFRMPALGQR